MIRREAIAWPFASSAMQGAFCLAIAALLAMPFVLHRLHAPSLAARMSAVPVAAGPYSFIERQIYEEKSDIDLLFVGESVMWVGVDVPQVAEGITAALGHTPRVLNLGWAGTGNDLVYYVLRELLERRHVRHVVLRLHTVDQMPVAPHPESYRWLCDCGDDVVLPALSVLERASAFGVEVIGGPRNLLSALRPDLVGASPFADTLGYYPNEKGYWNRPYRRLDLAPPVLAPATVILGPATRSRLLPEHVAEGPYQSSYGRATRDLLAAHHIHVTLLRFPARSEARATTLPVASEEVARYNGATILAPEPRALFQHLSDIEVDELYYYDDLHMNRNGSKYFTGAILPALVEVQREIDAQ